VNSTKTPIIRAMRSVKKEILKLFTLVVTSIKQDELKNFYENYVSYLFDSILTDYKQNIPQARESEVLILTSKIIEIFREPLMGNFIFPILESVFEPTLDMISKDFSDYPEHRIAFFSLLQSICTFCFNSLLSLPPNLFKLYIDSIIWAFKHTHREVADSGLLICLSLLENIENVNGAQSNEFYSKFYIPLLQDIFYVLSDADHRSGKNFFYH
jgi:exportin-1